jgi:hypothetical protein
MWPQVAGLFCLDMFAAGASGSILHCDGSAWTPMKSGTPDRLNAVFGF